MGDDTKIDKILQAVQDLQSNIQKIESNVQSLESNVQKLESNFKEERSLNNSRFTQLATNMMDIRKEMSKLSDMKMELKADINKVFTVYSEDFTAVVDDLDSVKKRVDRLEKKIA